MVRKGELDPKTLIILAIAGMILFVALSIGLPIYRVWSAGMRGRAEMAQAEQNKQIQRVEAEANLDAERLNAEAEVARAKGAAEAMQIVQDKLTEQYIRYRWVITMAGNDNVIYIPTEAGLPILEINR